MTNRTALRLLGTLLANPVLAVAHGEEVFYILHGAIALLIGIPMILLLLKPAWLRAAIFGVLLLAIGACWM